ncbi:hypothetical protein GA0070607_2927 [Micromonospora coriariae]|uniref:Uncharacterized protein n=1 Tax=Micromonospora coriariae TaxID=285665 RepID=A0A1C4W0J2_9ACTN|nr:hypothetical protein [Micromonospora coriariae]SCE89509.1 hypothetical protein GA0070607_2927 [Micromonospora coriariae]
MDAAADDRLRSAALVGVALAALAVGGWWWRAAAPVSTAGSAGPSAATPTVGPTVSTALERAMVAAPPDARVTVRLDSETGEVIERQSSSGVSIDPATGMVGTVDGVPGELFSQPDPSGGLPLFKETIWREERELTPGQGVTRQSTDDGSRYLLQYRCTRPGTMVVTSTGAAIAGRPRIDCDGTMASAEVLTGGGRFRVSLSAVGDGPIDVQVQLVALPR